MKCIQGLVTKGIIDNCNKRAAALALPVVLLMALVLSGCESGAPMTHVGGDKGTLAVSSDPPGARVFLDGENTGRLTPATFVVNPGSHTIRLTWSGEDWGPHRFTVTAGETTRVSATLSPMPDAHCRSGTSWTVASRRDVPLVSDYDLSDVAWSGRSEARARPRPSTAPTRFVAVGTDIRHVGSDNYTGVIIFSHDGMTWRRAAVPVEIDPPLRKTITPTVVAWSGGRFFAFSAIRSAYSSDGINWTFGGEVSSEASSDSPNDYWSVAPKDVVWGGAHYIAVGTGGIAYSSDGVTWMEARFDPSWLLNGITSNYERYVAVGARGVVVHSSDGIAWRKTDSLSRTTSLNGIAWNGGRFVAVGIDYAGAMDTQGDSVAHGIVLYSSDGNRWAEAYRVSSVVFTGVVWSGRCFVAVGSPAQVGGVAQGGGVVIHSGDGITWTEARTVPSSRNLAAVAGGRERLVAVGYEGLILHSP